MKMRVIQDHVSNYPNPITLEQGATVTLGETYNGPEDWDNWVLCHTLDQSNKGWVPEQLLVRDEGFGYLLEDYTAKELNVEKGAVVEWIRELNGWIWCVDLVTEEIGWLPKNNLIPAESN
jgi:hypothetical protein